ncbi:hypothetical protein SS50377_25862 [Spironucleus salmonicida]|uniref:Uncharacterized protein n=1 Tax=Spironucleus salmonicida TaxID=348837 RepID=V6LXS2_9EUKA|nr:hypothetical protein SS50377_25862 [Spironucleus salmonicida]|eukprot:EST49048.1 Hypothetical protein SS50377_10688 [Spironucleus salmonicida]
MLILLQFSCFEDDSQVIYNPITAQVTFTAKYITTETQLCSFLLQKTATPQIKLGPISFIGNPMIFTSEDNIFLVLDCPTPICATECSTSFDSKTCRDCKVQRTKLCAPASEATVAQIEYIFNEENIQMEFAAGKFLVSASIRGGCFQNYKVLYTQNQLIFSGTPFLCPIELTAEAIAAQAANNCKKPIGITPVDCPWIQVVINDQVISVDAYKKEDLLSMGSFKMDCDVIDSSYQKLCQQLMKEVNQLNDVTIQIQLAVAIKRNIGTTPKIDMPLMESYLITGNVNEITAKDSSDCFQDIQIDAFEHVSILHLKWNNSPKNCPDEKYDQVIVEISGFTSDFYQYNNILPSITSEIESFEIACTNAVNQTECIGNYSIALNDYRVNQVLQLIYLKDEQIVSTNKFSVSLDQEQFRNATIVIFEESICVHIDHVPWAKVISGDLDLQLIMNDQNIKWRQLYKSDKTPYCSAISRLTSSKISFDCLSSQGQLFVNGNEMPVEKCQNAQPPALFWKQVLILGIGFSGFCALVVLIFFTRRIKE